MLRHMGSALLVLALSGLGACHDEKKPCEEPYSCPDPVTAFDCMPPSQGMNNECVGECHDWIVENCPDVRFVF